MAEQPQTRSKAVFEGELVIHEKNYEASQIEVDGDSLEWLISEGLQLVTRTPAEHGDIGYPETHYGRCRITIEQLP